MGLVSKCKNVNPLNLYTSLLTLPLQVSVLQSPHAPLYSPNVSEPSQKWTQIDTILTLSNLDT